MKTQAIVLAAGGGKRFHAARPKVLTLLNGLPLVVLALKVFERCAWVESVILVVPRKHKRDFKALSKHYGLRKVQKII